MIPFTLKPTFPLDEREIQERIWKIKTGHPLTWLSFGAAAIAPWLIANSAGAAVFGMLLCLGIAAVGLSAFWKERETATKARVIEAMVAESNAEQDRHLNAVMNRYRRNGNAHYAVALGKFILLKEAIEKRLHINGKITELNEKIERHVDRLCASVCREFDKVILLDNDLGEVLVSKNAATLEKLQDDRSRILEKIMQAYLTLCECLDSVVEIDQSGDLLLHRRIAKSHRAESQLDDTIDQLKAEIEMARKVSNRIAISSDDDVLPGGLDSFEKESV